MAQSNQDRNHFKTNIQNHLEKQLAEGDAWYLVAQHWFEQCMRFIENENESNPGPIDNTALFKDEEDTTPLHIILYGKDEDSDGIRDNMIAEMDYKLVPAEVWSMLVERFTLEPGQQPIVRKVIRRFGSLEVEVELQKLDLTEYSDQRKIVKKRFSRMDTIGSIEMFMRTKFNIDFQTNTRLYSRYKQLDKRQNTIRDEGLGGLDTIIIEQMNDDGTWPRQQGCKRKAAQSTSQETRYRPGILKASRYESLDMEQTSISAKDVKVEIVQKLLTKIDCLNNKRMKLDSQETTEREMLEKKFMADKKSLEEKLKADKKSLAEKQIATRDKIDDSVKELSKTLDKINDVEENTELKKDMECPVCFDQMKPPIRIFQCTSGHLICEGCKMKMEAVKCPTCKEARIMGRNTAMEQLARTLYMNK